MPRKPSIRRCNRVQRDAPREIDNVDRIALLGAIAGRILVAENGKLRTA
jgi:hypothetical protein